MSLVQILVGVAALIGLCVLWAVAAKGVDAGRRFVDLDKDGAPDATPHEKEAAIAAFKEEQARRHPED